MKKYSLILMILILVGTSCKDFLDTKPQDFLSPEFYYSNEEEVNAALAGVYGMLSDTRSGFQLYSGTLVTFMGTEGDDGFYRKGPDRNVPGQFIYNASTARVEDFWRQLYQGINLANTLLEKLPAADMPDDNRAIVEGETLFLRSYFYFLLVSNFGDVPLKLTSTMSPNDNAIARTASTKVYQQITEDMEKAFELVPTAAQVGFGGRINQSAVAGILARVYLYWAGKPLEDETKYIKARDWALKVINTGAHLLNPSFEQVFINYAADKYDIKESIWEVEFAGNRSDYPRQAGVIGNYIGILSQNDDIGRSNANVQASARLYKKYLTGDLRRDWTIAPFEYRPVTDTNRVFYNPTDIYDRAAGKYRREYETVLPKSVGYTPINFPLLRYSDVLLMYAEADLKVNGASATDPGSDAVKYVNMVRRRGFGFPVTTPNPASDLTSDDLDGEVSFLLAIQDERSRELAFECLRKYDLIRWGIYLPAMKSLATEYQNSSAPSAAKNVTSTLANIGVKHIFFPIPTHELILNPKLTQNPGW